MSQGDSHLVPKVSVLLPVYNGERYLREALVSVLGQTFRDFELLILDDGSTDGSATLIREFSDPRIRCIRSEKNQGLITTLNSGLALARGALIARMDADDICFPARFETQVRFLDQNPDVQVVGTAVIEIDENSKAGLLQVYPIEGHLIRWLLLFENPFAHPTVMFRRRLVERLVSYDSNRLHAEDHDFWWRASREGSLAGIAEPLLYYRRHSGGISETQAERMASTGLEISMLAVQEVLGRSIPREQLKGLLSHRFTSLNEKAAALQSLVELHEAFGRRFTPKGTALKRMNADFAYRFFACAGADSLKPLIRSWVKKALQAVPGGALTVPATWWQRRSLRRDRL